MKFPEMKFEHDDKTISMKFEHFRNGDELHLYVKIENDDNCYSEQASYTMPFNNNYSIGTLAKIFGNVLDELISGTTLNNLKRSPAIFQPV